MAEPTIDRFVRRQNWLEPLGELIQRIVGGLYAALGPVGRPLKDLMHGTKPLGHPLHPALTDAPLGAWLVGLLLDYVAGISHLVPTQAGDIALLAGTVAALSAAATGYTDHHETFGLERRTATLHGLIMSTVLLLELASLGLRWKAGLDLHPLAVGLATVAVVAAAVGMYLGGHLSYGFGTMVNRNAFSEGPADYVAVGTMADFPENTMKRVDAAGMPALVIRMGGKLCAIAAVCSHAGGPLDEGELVGSTVICPWHQSRFDVCTGSVQGGPATFPQPQFLVREREGKVEVKLASPTH